MQLQGAMRLAAMQKDRDTCDGDMGDDHSEDEHLPATCAGNTVHQKIDRTINKITQVLLHKFQTTRAAFGTQRIPNCTPVSERQQATQHKYDVKFLILLDKLLRHDVDMVFPHSILATTSKSQGSHQK